VAVDGTKIKANASKHKAMSYGRMAEVEARLKDEVAAWWFEQAATIEGGGCRARHRATRRRAAGVGCEQAGAAGEDPPSAVGAGDRGADGSGERDAAGGSG
jgi:hypothetical protein